MIIYFFSIPIVRKQKLGNKVIRVLRIIIFIATPLLAAILIAQSFNIYPRGYWFTKGVFWLVIFSCVSLYGLCKKEFFWAYERMIYKIIFFLPLLFLIFLFVPIIGIGYGLIFYVKFIGDDKLILYNDKNIRIEQPYIRFMGPNPQPILYVKQKLISYQDTLLPIGYDDAKDTIVVKRLSDSTYTITFKSPNNWQVPTGSQSFQYNLKK